MNEVWVDIFYEGYIYIYINSSLNSLTKFTSSGKSTKLKSNLPWSISQMITKTIPISTGIVISYAMKWAILLLIWWKVNGNLNMIKIYQWRESHCRRNTIIRRKKEIQKGWTIRITVWDLSRKLTIWVSSFKINYNKAHQVSQLQNK